MLDHERLDVYHLALEFLVFANGVIEGLPRGRSHLADQFTRASLSIVLNVAEGAGKHSKPDKRRYYFDGERLGDRVSGVVGCLRSTRAARCHRTQDGQGEEGAHRVDAGQGGPELRSLKLDSQPK